jgi:hypothetical protein
VTALDPLQESPEKNQHNPFKGIIIPGLFASPLRWYAAFLLIGCLVSLPVSHPFEKFQVQRFAEVALAIGMLAWCYRPEAAGWLGRPLGSGWYGLGLLGFAGVTVVASVLGPIPWISLGFLGLVLLQFGLLPLLKEAWRQNYAEGFRMLALLAVALVGLDVGLWLVARAFEIPPYAWVRRVEIIGGQVSKLSIGPPYLFQNPRWANQVSLLLVWTFIPLLQQLQQGVVQRCRRFWWGICGGVPLLCCTQIVLSQGDGAFLSVLFGIGALFWQWRRSQGSERHLLGRALVLVLLALVASIGFSLALDAGDFLFQFSDRNTQELAVGASASGWRLSSWILYLKSSLLSPLWGHGIQAIPLGSALCGPHNVWLSLLYWCGLIGTGFSLLFMVAFVPLEGRGVVRRASSMTLPFLVSLFFYQLVDDIWLRSLSLALLLVILPALLPEDGTSGGGLMPAGPAWIQSFSLCFERYRLLALVGVLLIALSVVVPGGVGWGPQDSVSLPKQACMLFF